MTDTWLKSAVTRIENLEEEKRAIGSDVRDVYGEAIREFQRHRFGRRAESLSEDQMQLALEDTEQEVATVQATSEQANPTERKLRAGRRRTNRGTLPAHLPRIEMVVDVSSTACPCCSGSRTDHLRPRPAT